jgi:hypothetical protein
MSSMQSIIDADPSLYDNTTTNTLSFLATKNYPMRNINTLPTNQGRYTLINENNYRTGLKYRNYPSLWRNVQRLTVRRLDNQEQAVFESIRSILGISAPPPNTVTGSVSVPSPAPATATGSVTGTVPASDTGYGAGGQRIIHNTANQITVIYSATDNRVFPLYTDSLIAGGTADKILFYVDTNNTRRNLTIFPTSNNAIIDGETRSYVARLSTTGASPQISYGTYEGTGPRIIDTSTRGNGMPSDGPLYTLIFNSSPSTNNFRDTGLTIDLPDGIQYGGSSGGALIPIYYDNVRNSLFILRNFTNIGKSARINIYFNSDIKYG